MKINGPYQSRANNEPIQPSKLGGSQKAFEYNINAPTERGKELRLILANPVLSEQREALKQFLKKYEGTLAQPGLHLIQDIMTQDPLQKATILDLFKEISEGRI